MTGFASKLEESSAKMREILGDHVNFLEEARTKAFPDGDPAVAHKNVLNNAFENYEEFDKIDTKAWMALPSKGQYSNFSFLSFALY